MGLMDAGGGLASGKLKLATAAENEVLSGETFYAGGKDLKTGSMPNHGAWGTTISPGGSVTIPQGYHNGGGKVTSNYPTVHRKLVWTMPATLSSWQDAYLNFNIAGYFTAEQRARITKDCFAFDAYMHIQGNGAPTSGSDIACEVTAYYPGSGDVSVRVGSGYEFTISGIRCYVYYAD